MIFSSNSNPYAHTYMQTYTHTYIHTHTYMQTYIHTYKHTYMHANIHTYIHRIRPQITRNFLPTAIMATKLRSVRLRKTCSRVMCTPQKDM